MQRIRQLWWYASDAAYRTQYNANRRRVRAFRAAQTAAMRALAKETDGVTVLSGPFSGMRYLTGDGTRVFPQKILGTYEKELWPVIESVSARDYAQIVDIGAAEGYYVVGLALRVPKAHVIAFEANRKLHHSVTALADRNGVRKQIEIRGLCDAPALNECLIGKDTLVICDIEGYEADVLDPTKVQELEHADILVEVHDHIRPEVSSLLRSRFDYSHNITVISSRERDATDIPASLKAPAEVWIAGMDECRGVIGCWFWMTRRQ